jgi:hypothetical protein
LQPEGERLASLEAHAEDAVRERHEIRTTLKNQDIALSTIRHDVHEINVKLSNWRGFFSGMVFTIAAIAGIIGAGLTALWNYLAARL